MKLPPGFRIEPYASVPGARSLTLGDDGTVYVGTMREGAVYAIPDRNRDHRADRVLTLARGLNLPNGVAFKDGALYVAEVHRVLRYDRIGRRLQNPPPPAVVYDRLPTERLHGWKFIAFGPDGWLYVPVGAPCNVCEPEPPLFGTIARVKPDGSDLEVFARGVRNSVGFDWNPSDGRLWFTDNGRDWLGDDLPPDELNRAPVKGLHFGFPYRYGDNVPDPEFGEKGQGLTFTPPAFNFEAHVAALGMRFYRGKMFPRRFRGNIIVAQHGSWNRSRPIGYRLVLVELGGGRPRQSVFVDGWLQEGKYWGRPVDVQELADGSLLVSDDHAGRIYRITYAGETGTTGEPPATGGLSGATHAIMGPLVSPGSVKGACES